MMVAIACATCSETGTGPLAVIPQRAKPSNAIVATGSYDAARTGADTAEGTLTTTNVNVTQFGALFTRATDGDMYAQPLYLPGVSIPGHGKRNVVFLATEHDTVYAYDADNPAATEPFWKTSVGISMPIPNPYFAVAPDERCNRKEYNMHETGITSTPAIDPDGTTIYVVGLVRDPTQTVPHQTCTDIDPTSAAFCNTYLCDAPVLRLELHALDVTTGAERPHSPVTLTATLPGEGAGTINGMISLDPTVALQRPGLLFANQSVYIAFGSYADLGDFHGWILRYDPETLAQKAAFVTTPGTSGGSIWQSGHGVTADDEGNLYVMTGNGPFNANQDDGTEYGDSFLKLDPDLKLLDWFTPALANVDGQQYLDWWDEDLGSSGPVFLRDLHLIVGGGKQGVMYLLDPSALGHFETDGPGPVESFMAAWRLNKSTCSDAVSDSNIHGSPVYWSGPKGPTLYVWGEQDYLKAYALVDGRVTLGEQCFCTGKESYLVEGYPPDPRCGMPTSKSTEAALGFMPGGVLTVSAHGGDAGTGIVWASRARGPDDASETTVAGVLEAYDATDVSRRLWTSEENPTRDSLGNFAKFTPATVANGKVYLATFSGKLMVYGLIGQRVRDAGAN